ALGEEVNADHLAIFVNEDWAGEHGVANARRLVEAGIEFWSGHRALLSTIGVLADRRHGAFAALRVRQMRGLYKSFEQKVRLGQGLGRISSAIQPRLAGYECVAMLSSIGQTYALLRSSGFSHAEPVETTARLLHGLVV